MALFDLAIPIVFRHEGGYVDDPSDPGGETKYGISHRSYPSVDIPNLTVEEANAIYRRDWWDKYGYGNILPQAVANKVFDTAVNLGAQRAHKILQEACGVFVDGQIGPETLNAVNTKNSADIIFAMQNLQAQHYLNLIAVNPALTKFKDGWLKRAYDQG